MCTKINHTSGVMKFLIVLAQQNEDFRASELKAIAELYNINLDLQNYRADSPFLEVDLPTEEDAKKLVSRSIMSKAVYRIFSQGESLEEIHVLNKANMSQFQGLMGKSFKIEFNTYQSTRSKESQLTEINNLSYLNLDGPIRMKNPDITLVVVESYTDITHQLVYAWFTKLVAISDRSAMGTYDLKKRKNVGTTSFEAELSLVTANMAQIQSGDYVFDPFSGTGSFPLAAAHHGAYVFASDIDVRPLRKYPPNFAQYGTTNKLIDAFEMDFTHCALHPRLKFDAIICDPPYGVRERIVVCGAAKPERFVGKENVVIENELAYLRTDYIATKKPYDLSLMLRDLFEFAASRLNAGRRLAFWLPLEESEVKTTEIPLHKDLEFKDISVQKFPKWERWLLVYQRRPFGSEGPERPIKLDDHFREKYLARYKKSVDNTN